MPLRPLFILLTTLAMILPGAARAVVMLQYHHIDSSTPASTSTPPELFAEHLQYLKDNNFRVVPLPEITQKLRHNELLPDKTVVITFDDAYISIYKTALPLLRKHQFPFTVFVNTGAVDQKQSRTMTWEQLRELQKHGATLANHTVHHGHLVEREKGETTEQWVNRVSRELAAAEQRISSETGSNLKLMAWPFGESAPELEAMILGQGYLGFGQQSGAVSLLSNPAKLPRYPLGAGYGAMKNFPLKANSLPLPVISTSPDSGIAPRNGRIATLTLTLKPGNWSSDQIACYALGETLALTWLDKEKTLLRLKLPDQLPLGRSRVNCTSPGPDRRWYWFSQSWVRLTKDGKALD